MQLEPKRGFKKLSAKIGVWAVAILFVCGPCAWANGKPSGGGSGGGGSKASDIPLTFHVFDADAGAASYYVQGDDVQGYYDGSSSEYDNGTDNVTAVLQGGGLNGISNGDGLLNLQSSSRQLRITLSSANALPGTDPANSPFGQQGWGLDNSRLQIACTRASLSMLNMSAGQKISCPMSIQLSTGQTKNYYYLLIVGPVDPETSQAVQVQCNAADQTGCYDWFVDPIPTVDAQGNTSPGQAEARLSTVCTTGRCTATDEGDYYLTFHFHVTRP